MTYYQYGNLGVFDEIYSKHKTFNGYVEVSTNGENAQNLPNLFQWNSSTGYHSEIYDTYPGKQLYVSFKFKHSFWLKAYRIAILKENRFSREWEIRTSYRDSDPFISHQSNELLCQMDSLRDCAQFTEKLFILQSYSKCDKIDYVLTGTDSWNTYSIAIAALEFYSAYRCGQTYKISIRPLKSFVYLFICLLIQ